MTAPKKLQNQISDFFRLYPINEIADEFHRIIFYLQSSRHFNLLKAYRTSTTTTLQLLEDVCRKLQQAMQKETPTEIIEPLIYELRLFTSFQKLEPVFWMVTHSLNDSKDFDRLESSKKAYKTGLVNDLRLLMKSLFYYAPNIQVLNMN